ncbi:hypothetical protein AA313_de0203153 [Arthrobotrys entomopaga]|nr:hypothetical protein AA313_de0203153 [Arthrobotrys entomopaga]
MYSTVLIIGAGESGLCMGVQLKTKFNHTDFVIYERHSDIGGTWYANTYPGVACDVPALCYSYSFATNPDWSTFYPQGPELHAYFTKVCDDYKLRPHITFNTEVESATYDEQRQIWSVRLRRRQAGDTWTHECKILFTAVGGLIEPADINLKGMESFKGSIFHSAVWDHSVDIQGKDVVLVGNGCSAAQIVPVIEPKVKSLTQVIRSSHWLLPRPHFPGVKPENYEKWSPTVFKFIPGSQTVARALTFLSIEAAWLAFRNGPTGDKLRAAQERTSIQHIKAKAPEKYWDLLIPTFPIGFKRRIYDDTYLPSLKSDKVLLTKDDVTHVSEHAVHTASGKEYKADVVVMATGYKTNEWIAPLKIVGRNGETMSDHWKKIGGPAAYNTTAVSGFPNCFLIVGPNSITGHTSVILATENIVRYALHIATPVLKGDASEVEVTKEAEVKYSSWMQETMKKTVFNNQAFRSWYVREDGWNSSTYPRSQVHFMYRSYFPNYKDWIIKKTQQGIWKTRIRKILALFLIFGFGVSHLLLKKRGLTLQDAAKFAAFLLLSKVETTAEALKEKLF